MKIMPKRNRVYLALTICFALVISTTTPYGTPHAAAQQRQPPPPEARQPPPTVAAPIQPAHGQPYFGQPAGAANEVFGVPRAEIAYQDLVNQQQPGGGGMSPGMRNALIIIAVVGAIAAAAYVLHKVNAKTLDKDGPQLPDKFSMSNFTFKAYVKGDWPLFIDYELERPGNVALKIKRKHQPDFEFVFDGKQPGRYEQLIRLPATLGGQPDVATYTITAREPGRPRAAVPLVINTLGAGDNAVGSSGFDSIDFKPGTVVVSRNGRANYSFRSKRDFGAAAADFMMDSRTNDEVYSDRAGRQLFDRGVRTGESRSGDWDCMNSSGRPSLGKHKLFVRGWRGRAEGGDWMMDTSRQRVTVR